jgi:cytochrome P450
VSKPSDQIPGRRGWPVIGDTIPAVRDPWRFDHEMTRRYGPINRSRVLGVDWVNLTSPSLASVALLDRERCLSSERGWAPVLGQLFPGGLMLRDFDDHQRHRKLMQAAFREPARRGYQALVDRETARSVASWGATPQLELYPALKQALIEQAATVFLGLDLGGAQAEFVRAFTAMMDASIAPLKRDWPGTSFRRGLRARAWLTELLAAEAPARRGRSGSDLFTLLCNVEGEAGERFAEREAVDHVVFVLLAAHDTSATALATLFDALVADPELQERLRDECRSLGSTELSFDQIDSLVACDRTHREALRLNPPVPYILRSNLRPLRMGGHTIATGSALNVTVRMVHVDPLVWTEPERFDPERFCPARAEHQRHPHGYIPFGGGAHRCIGADFARQQGLTFVYHVLTRYRIHGQPCRWQRLPIPRPRDGQPVVLEPALLDRARDGTLEHERQQAES